TAEEPDRGGRQPLAFEQERAAVALEARERDEHGPAVRAEHEVVVRIELGALRARGRDRAPEILAEDVRLAERAQPHPGPDGVRALGERRDVLQLPPMLIVARRPDRRAAAREGVLHLERGQRVVAHAALVLAPEAEARLVDDLPVDAGLGELERLLV